MARIGIIAAMEREVGPLIRSWRVRMIEHSGRRYRLFEDGDAVLVCGGIGAEAARRATEAVIQEVHPARVMSAGFAGAVDGSLPGQVVEPRTVINAADGARTEISSGEGILVSSATVAGKEQKAYFGRTYDATAVDMEAAAVAQGAAARGVEFGVLKAISDAADFDMPIDLVMDRFVSGDGCFQSARFARHVGLRPWLWGTTIALARNSSKASCALSSALAGYLTREALNRQLSLTDALAGAVNQDANQDVKQANQTGLDRADEGTCAGAHTQTRTEAHTRVADKR